MNFSRILILCMCIFLFLETGHSFIVYDFPDRLVINYTISLKISGEKGKITLSTNKIPVSQYHQVVQSKLPSEFEYTFKEKGVIRDEFSTIITLYMTPSQIKEKIPYQRENTTLLREIICYDGYCDEAYKLLRALVSEYLSDDLFKTVCYINHFVNKFITYDISFVNDQQPRLSNILTFKRGVCVHYAYFLHEILNSIGIKNQIVYGFAKNSANSTAWEPHAWIKLNLSNKVLFFDPTFDICGYLTPYHLYLSNNSLITSMSYFGFSKDVEFSDEIKITEIETSQTYMPSIFFDFEFFEDEIYHNESAYLTVTVKNNEPFYIFSNFKLVSADEVTILPDEFFFVLEPFEEKNITVILKHSLKDVHFDYVVPVVLYSSWSQSVTKNFKIVNRKSHQREEKINPRPDLPSVQEDFEIECFLYPMYYSNTSKIKIIYRNQTFCLFRSKGKPFIETLNVSVASSDNFETHSIPLILSKTYPEEVYFDEITRLGINNIILNIANKSVNFTVVKELLNISYYETDDKFVFYDPLKYRKEIKIKVGNKLIYKNTTDDAFNITIDKKYISDILKLTYSQNVSINITVVYDTFAYIFNENISINVSFWQSIKNIFKIILENIINWFYE
ncbi:MAG: transglutaminase domain-containing protein [Candidatus Woesearchaeota archaeon]